MIELFPQASRRSTRMQGAELAAYTDAAGRSASGRLRQRAQRGRRNRLEDRWRAFHRQSVSGGSGSVRRGRRRPTDAHGRRRDRAAPSARGRTRRRALPIRRCRSSSLGRCSTWLRVRRPVDRRRAARFRAGSRRRHRGTIDRGDARERARERRPPSTPGSSRATSNSQAHRSSSRTFHSSRRGAPGAH